MKIRMIGVFGLIAVFVMTGAAGANLLSNGDFETSVAIVDTNNVPTGLYSAAEWTQWGWGNGWSEITVKAENKGGNSTILLNVGNGWYNGGGGAYQTVAATEGQWYQLTVDCGADAWWQPTGEMALVWLDGVGAELGKTARFTVDQANGIPNDTLQPMQNFALYGVAPVGAVEVKVEFASRMPDGVGGAITFDNAELIAVPEPATLGLLGLSGLALWIRRKMM